MNLLKLFLVDYTKIMVPYSSDTHPKMEALQIEQLRLAPSFRKMEMLVSLNRADRSLVLAGLRQRYPQASDAALRRCLAEILLGPDLARRVFGDEASVI